MLDGHITLDEGSFRNGGFILPVGHRLSARKIQHTGLLTKGRTDSAGELGEVIGLLEYLVGRLPLAPVKCIIPLGVLVAKRTCPVTERDSAIHATACLLLTVFGVQCLFNLSKVQDPVMNRTITGLLPRHSKKCFRVSHNLLWNKV